MATPLSVLILEDRPFDAELMLYELKRAGFAPIWERVENEQDYVAQLEKTPDVILADYSLPQFDAVRALDLLQARGLDIPFIVVTATVGEEAAVECMRQGAADYLLKDRLSRLGLAVQRALGAKQARDEKRQAEDELRASLERYRLVARATNDALWDWDLTTNQVGWNEAVHTMLGYALDEVGPDVAWWTERIHPDDRERVLTEVRRVIDGGAQAWSAEYRFRRRDGTDVIVLDRGYVARDDEGAPVRLISLMVDLTERRRAEEERVQLLREQAAREEAEAAHRRFAFLAEASTALAASLEYEATLESVARLAVPQLADLCVVDLIAENGAIRRVAAVSADPQQAEVVRELQRRFAPDPGGPHPVAKVLRTGRPDIAPEITASVLATIARDSEHLKIARELDYRSHMVVPLVARGKTLGAMSFVSGPSGRRYGAADLALAEDLARRAVLAVDNARLYREANDANRAKDEFLATLSHELRTPLTAMLGWVRILRTGTLDEATVTRALRVVERNTRLQTQLIDDLLDVSRIILGKFSIDNRAVDLIAVIEAAIDAVAQSAEDKGIRLRKALDPSVGPVWGDADRLQQVVWNLLANAIKFTPKGGTVEIQLDRVDPHVRIRVTDTGMGISPEFLPTIFEPFRQGDSTSTRAHRGLGLGLAIVRHLVELHKGIVYADSAGLEQGATFTVKLPVMAIRLEPDDVESTVAPTRDRGAFSAQFPILERVRVLVVDDEADARDFLATLLHACQAEVLTVASLREARDAMATFRPDVLVSDLAMPDGDGYELIRQIRNLPPERGGRIPAVALTAYASEEDRRHVLSAGFQMYASKPVEPAELATMVATLAGRTPHD